MSAYRYLMVLMCVVLISVGQVLFKYAALNSNKQQGLIGLIFNKYLIVAGVVYAAATLLWVWQLKFVPLNRAYPVFAAAFIIVPCFSWLLFRERVTLPYVFGVMFIIFGVALCGRNMS